MTYYSLIQPVPLRNSTEWPNYPDSYWLPHAFGTVTISPIRYDTLGRVWFLCDHPIQGVDSVTPAQGFNWYNAIDYTGRACSFVEISGSELESVTLRAKMHPSTGALIRNPAEIFWSVINISRTVAAAEFDQFRLDCQDFDIACDGVIDDGTRTTRDYLSEISSSIGAIWSGFLSGWGRIYPRASMPTYEQLLCTLDETNADITSLICTAEGIKTVLRLLYDYDHSSGTPRKSMQLEATEEVKNYRLTTEMSLRWVSSNHLAYQIGTRLLQYLARKKWNIGAVVKKSLTGGNYLTANHSLLPSSGNIMVLGCENNIMDNETAITFEQIMGTAPNVELTQTSAAFVPEEA